MTVALDFDGVIHRYGRGWQDGQIYDVPMAGAIGAIKTIMEIEAVVVFTARTDLDAVVEWLKRADIDAITQDEWDAERPAEERSGVFWNEQGRVLVTNRKPAARVYLDDRAVRFTKKGGWDQALQDMEITPRYVSPRPTPAQKIQKVRDLHRADVNGFCRVCLVPGSYDEPYIAPCPTAQALD